LGENRVSMPPPTQTRGSSPRRAAGSPPVRPGGPAAAKRPVTPGSTPKKVGVPAGGPTKTSGASPPPKGQNMLNQSLAPKVGVEKVPTNLLKGATVKELLTTESKLATDVKEKTEALETHQKSFEAQMGEKLMKRNVLELLRNWDKDGSGAISKEEFQLQMSNLGMESTGKEFNDFFHSIDKDHSGSINLEELRPALKKFKEQAIIDSRNLESMQKELAHLRHRKDDLEVLNKRMARFNDLWLRKQVTLDDKKASQPLNIKLGDYLNHAQWSAEEWISQWDKDGEGTISKGEFKQRMAALKVNPMGHGTDQSNIFLIADRDGDNHMSTNETTNVEKLFARLDVNSDGRLDVKETAKALKILQDEAKDVLKEWDVLEAEILDLWNKEQGVRAAIKAIMMADRQDREVEYAKNHFTLEEKVGMHMSKKANVSSLLFMWDKSADGKVDKDEFKRGIGLGNVREGGLGVTIEASDEEIDMFYEDHDPDNSGALDIQELKVIIKRMNAAANAAEKDYEDKKEEARRLRKVANALLKTELADENTTEEEKKAAAAKAKEDAKPKPEPVSDEPLTYNAGVNLD